MKTSSNTRAVLAALFGLVWAATASPVLADVKDYEFQLVQSELKQGDGAIVAVRLVDKKTGQAVPDAVIFAKRMDMAPDGMPTMTADLEPLTATEPGIYRFRTTLGMEGRWQLSLAAKVHGETGTLQTRLVIEAKN